MGKRRTPEAWGIMGGSCPRALLYRVTGHPEESLKVLERLFILMPKIPGIESTQINNEARNLYSEIRAETESKTTTMQQGNNGFYC